MEENVRKGWRGKGKFGGHCLGREPQSLGKEDGQTDRNTNQMG